MAHLARLTETCNLHCKGPMVLLATLTWIQEHRSSCGVLERARGAFFGSPKRRTKASVRTARNAVTVRRSLEDTGSYAHRQSESSTPRRFDWARWWEREMGGVRETRVEKRTHGA